MRKQNIVALSIFIVFYVLFGIFLTLNQESIVYHPSAQDFYACPNFVTADKITHHDTRMYVENTSKPVAIVYHGNAGSACDRSLYADILTQAGYGYIVVEYAGFSNDPERPSHARIKQDVENVISYLQTENIEAAVAVGESIGTGFASYHAYRAPPAKLLLIAPFTDLLDVAKERFWFYPTSLLVDNALDNVEALSQYAGEVTIIHGTEDTIIPYKLGNQLHESLSTEKNIVPIDGAGHNDIFRFEQTYSAIADFLEMN